MTTTLINPSTGAALREVPSTSAEEAGTAIERAQDAFTSWRGIAPGERARLLRSFASVVDAHVEELARLEVENSGHTIGNAYTSDHPQVPSTMLAARDRFAGSELARAAFGDEVVDHYVNMADVELASFDAHVTDWELARSFERM